MYRFICFYLFYNMQQDLKVYRKGKSHLHDQSSINLERKQKIKIPMKINRIKKLTIKKEYAKTHPDHPDFFYCFPVLTFKNCSLFFSVKDQFFRRHNHYIEFNTFRLSRMPCRPLKKHDKTIRIIQHKRFDSFGEKNSLRFPPIVYNF